VATVRRPTQLDDVRAAAIELFAERGYRGTGIRDIAQALGLGPTSVYSHIGSKQELLRDIVLGACRAVAALQEEALAMSTDPVERLRRAVEAHVRYITRYRREALVTTQDFDEVEEPASREVLELRARIQGTLQGVIEAGVAAGALAVDDPKIASFAIIEMCEGVARWFRETGALPEARIAGLYGEFAVRLAGGER
jgi:AcrR family transcriptional regulator